MEEKMNIEWPIEEKLNILLESRGKEAFSALVYRKAMRMLPFLALDNISGAWNSNKVYGFFCIFRATVFAYYQSGIFPKNMDFKALNTSIEGASDMYGTEATRAYSDIADDAIAGATVSYICATSAYAVASASKYAFPDAVAYAKSDPTNVVIEAVDRYSNSQLNSRQESDYTVKADPDEYGEALLQIFSLCEKELINDYNFLINENDVLELLTKQLWSVYPENYENIQSDFISKIEALKLGFLNPYLEKLLNSQRCEESIINFLNPVNSRELRNARDIKKMAALSNEYTDNYASRIILIGPGGAGKTSLYQLMTKGRNIQGTKPTEGVEYSEHQHIDLIQHKHLIKADQLGGTLDNMKLYLWDFGGQAIFHNLHSAFMHEDCIYILVVDSRHEQAPDEWLAQIKSVTNDNAKVLIVTNWFDGLFRAQNKSSLIRRFPQLIDESSFHEFSCLKLDEERFSKFLNELLRRCGESHRKIYISTQKAMSLIADIYKKQRFITKSELRVLLRDELKISDIGEINTLIKKLQEFGRYVPVAEDGTEMCIKPEWIIGRAYRLINNKTVQNKYGFVTRDEVTDALLSIDESTDVSDIDRLTSKILHFLIEQELCLKISGEQYFLPDASKASEPEYIGALINSSNFLELVYELDYLPIGLRTKMVFHISKSEEINIDIKQDIWRDGLVVSSVNSRDKIVIEYLPRKQHISLKVFQEVSEGVVSLLGELDKLLSKLTQRKILGHMTIKDIYKDEPSEFYGSRKNDKPNIERLFEILENRNEHNLTIQLIKEMKNIDVNDSPGATIGDSNSTKAKFDKSFNKDSFNNPTNISDAQLEFMLEVISRVIKDRVNKDPLDYSALNALTKVSEALKQSNGKLEINDKDKESTILKKLWGVAKEADTAVGISEKLNKYIPIATAAVQSVL